MRRFVTSGPGVSLLIVFGIFAVLVICYLKFSSEARFAVTLSPPEGFTILSINRQAHRGSGSFAGYLPEGPNTLSLSALACAMPTWLRSLEALTPISFLRSRI